MADTKKVIKGMKLSDGTEFDVSALSNENLKYITTSSNGHLQLTSPSGKNVKLKASKHLKLEPGANGSKAGQIEIISDGTLKANQVTVKTLVTSDINLDPATGEPLPTPIWNPPVSGSEEESIRLKLQLSEVELNNKDSADVQKGVGAGDLHLDVSFKNDNDLTNAKLKARSIDVRASATTTAPGSGGGIAMQIASCDSNYKENKFKIETSRKVAPEEGLADGTSGKTWADFYTKTGGDGIEIGTINSQFESLYTKEFRRGAETEVFAVTRGVIEGDEESGKWDFPTQTDDSKDIKPDGATSIVWRDIVNAAIYLKNKHFIPNETDTKEEFETGELENMNFVYKA